MTCLVPKTQEMFSLKDVEPVDDHVVIVFNYLKIMKSFNYQSQDASTSSAVVKAWDSCAGGLQFEFHRGDITKVLTQINEYFQCQNISTCLVPKTHEMFSRKDVEPVVETRVVREPCFDMFTQDSLQSNQIK